MRTNRPPLSVAFNPSAEPLHPLLAVYMQAQDLWKSEGHPTAALEYLQPHMDSIEYADGLSLSDKLKMYMTFTSILCDRNAFAQALPYTKLAVKLSPDDLYAITRHAKVLRHLGHFEEAREWYSRGFEINPYDVVLMKSFASFHQRLGDTEKAIEWFEKAREIRPNDPSIATSLTQLRNG